MCKNWKQVGKVNNYLFIYLLKAYSTRSPHRVTSGLFSSNLAAQVEYIIKHAHYTNVKHTNMVSGVVYKVTNDLADKT